MFHKKIQQPRTTIHGYLTRSYNNPWYHYILHPLQYFLHNDYLLEIETDDGRIMTFTCSDTATVNYLQGTSTVSTIDYEAGLAGENDNGVIVAAYSMHR